MKRNKYVASILGVGIVVVLSFSSVLAGTSPRVSDPLAPQILPADQLVTVTTGEPNSLDPAWDYETVGIEIIQQIYEPLIAFNRERTDEYIPVLATDWTVSEDIDVITFTIRQGVQFHNGNILTAEDVAYTFQRGILQGGYNSPQWLFTEPILGTGIHDICEIIDTDLCDNRAALVSLQASNPSLVASACQDVKAAITFDETLNQVTFHLAQPWGPMLNTFVGAWGSIIDKEWAATQGAWDGSCSTWQNFYAPETNGAPPSALDEIALGTGPFMLENYDPGVEIKLVRNTSYWRTEPMWEDGPTGPTSFSSFTQYLISDGVTRADMLLSGDTDLGVFDLADYDRLYDEVLFVYDDPAGVIPTLLNPDGTLKLYRGGLAPSATDAFFTYQIVDDGIIHYIGSGALDGDGVPPDFFSDIHVRKAFNYAFDWDVYNEQIFGSAGVQRSGPIIAGLIGYDAAQPKYSYSPTLALGEFNQAWGGLLEDYGFTITFAYNTGNAQRKAFLENLQTNIQALDPDFTVNVIELDWPTYLADYRAKRLPIATSGWLQDIPHPHNWVVPYLTGTYADRQNLPDDIQSKYDAKINTCVELTGETAKTCYEDIQTNTYEDALDIFLVQGRVRQFSRAEIQGYYLSQATGNLQFYYQVTKGELPAVDTVIPDADTSTSVTNNAGSITTLDIPADTVDEQISIVLVPDLVTNGEPAGYLLGGLAFDIQAYDGDGLLIDAVTLNQPVTITLHYVDEDILFIDEATLQLFWWDGTNWVDAACGAYVRDLVNNILEVPICHFSSFAVGGDQALLYYLPMATR